MTNQFKSFSEFYPFYLSEHRNRNCRRMHFAGSSLVLVLLVVTLVTGSWLLLLLAPVVGYGCAWIGHFRYEKNQPATFRHPLYSLVADWVMYKDILLGKVKL